MCSTAGKALDAWDVALCKGPELLRSNKQGMSLGTRALAFCATLTRAEPDRLSEMIMPSTQLNNPIYTASNFGTSSTRKAPVNWSEFIGSAKIVRVWSTWPVGTVWSYLH